MMHDADKCFMSLAGLDDLIFIRLNVYSISRPFIDNKICKHYCVRVRVSHIHAHAAHETNYFPEIGTPATRAGIAPYTGWN